MFFPSHLCTIIPAETPARFYSSLHEVAWCNEMPRAAIAQAIPAQAPSGAAGRDDDEQPSEAFPDEVIC